MYVWLASTEREVAEKSVLIKNMLEDIGGDGAGGDVIPVPNVRSGFAVAHHSPG